MVFEIIDFKFEGFVQVQVKRRQILEVIQGWVFATQAQQKERRPAWCLHKHVCIDIYEIKTIKRANDGIIRACEGDMEESQEGGQGIRSINVEERLQSDL